jgi:hypothetical protein
VFTTVFPYEAVMEGPGTPAGPHILTATGRVLTIDFGSGPEPQAIVPVATTVIQNESWHMRNLVPEAFVRSDFAEFSWFGVSNLSNTSPVPMFPTDEGGVRMLLSYDAGRPVEVRPDTLSYVTPIGRVRDYLAAVGNLFTPMIMTTGHPVYDPDFDAGRPRLIYTNIVPQVTAFLNVNRPISADLYVVTWDGGPAGPTPPLRVEVGGEPVILEQASAHQMCLTEHHVVIMEATLVLDVASLVKPVAPLLRAQLARLFGGRLPERAERLYASLTGRLKAAVPPSHTNIYVIAKADLRRALATGARTVPAARSRLDFEATHALADHDDSGGVITLYCQHNVGADPADQLDSADELLDGRPINPGLDGMFSASTDLNQVRKQVIDAATGDVLSTIAFPDPASAEDFPYGLNLLPPMQVLPYRPDGDGPYNLQGCTRRWDCTFWVTGGWPEATSVRRVFETSAAADRKRLLPQDEYVKRVSDARNSVRLFRLDPSMNVESAYTFEPGVLMGAPVFVPREGATSVRDGFLVGSVWRHDDPAMQLWIFDADADLADGPACVLAAPDGAEGVRPGFPLHGCWIEAGGVAAWKPPAYRVPMIEVRAGLKWAQTLAAGATVMRRLVQQKIAGRRTSR